MPSFQLVLIKNTKSMHSIQLLFGYLFIFNVLFFIFDSIFFIFDIIFFFFIFDFLFFFIFDVLFFLIFDALFLVVFNSLFLIFDNILGGCWSDQTFDLIRTINIKIDKVSSRFAFSENWKEVYIRKNFKKSK